MKKLITCLLLLSASVFNVAMASPWGCFKGAEDQYDAHLRSKGITFGSQDDGLVQSYWFDGPLGSMNPDTTAEGAWILNATNHCECSHTFDNDNGSVSGLCGHY